MSASTEGESATNEQEREWPKAVTPIPWALIEPPAARNATLQAANARDVGDLRRSGAGVVAGAARVVAVAGRALVRRTRSGSDFRPQATHPGHPRPCRRGGRQRLRRPESRLGRLAFAPRRLQRR